MKIEYPFLVCIYSKDRYVKQHRRCFFFSKNVRSTHDQVIDHVVWQHCGKGSGAFWTDTNCSSITENRTKFCLQDIIDICNYNGVQFELSETSVILKERHHKLNMEVQATITERDNKMYITWVYRPFMYGDPILYLNELSTDVHQITVLDMEQLKQVIEFDMHSWF
jgi:hypothetical protein